MPTDTMEVYLNSSANDVWGAVIAGTTVFPKAIRGLYHQIKSVDGDGYTAGSMRTITFGHLFNRVAQTATEKILDIDHEKLTIESTFTEDGGFIPNLFDTFDVKLTVVKSARQMRAPGCSIKWEFTYDGANGNASLTNLKNIMMQAFKDLDVYLRNHRGIRAP
ncbi:MLP-like protein 423 [Linum grandiflorum]